MEDKPLVVLVDDEAAERELLGHRLALEFRVRVAADVEEALAEVRREPPDVIVTDIAMPGADGIELLRLLRRSPETQTIPVLLISARVGDEAHIEGFEIDADGYLQKPFTERELIARVWSLVRMARLRAQAARQLGREEAEREALIDRATLLESITDGFYGMDEQWRFTYVNKKAVEYFHAGSRDELLGRTIWECVPAARDSAIHLRLARVMQERQPAVFEALSAHSKAWVEVHAYPAKQGIAVYFRDISQRKRDEASLREAQERYRAFVRNSSEAIWRYELEEPLDLSLPPEAQLDHLYRYAYLAEANDALARMYGYDRADEMIGSRLQTTLPREDEGSLAYVRHLIENDYRIIGVESTERDRTGSVRHFANSMVPVIEQGKLVRAWGSQRDITVQKLSEASLRDSAERLRRAVSVGTVGVLFFRLDGTITDANETFERMSGYPREELLTQTHWKKLTVETFHALTESHANDLLKHGATEPYEKQMRRKDGSLWWGLFAPTRLGGEGEQTECVEFIIDITEQRLAQRALEQADRRKDEFLATLAHELRNPLAPLKNGLQIARLTNRAHPSLERTIDMMDRQLNHLVHLVNDLLDVARISSGKVVLRREPVLLREVLALAIEASRASLDAQGHELLVEGTTEDLVVQGDVDRLSQVFTNLLSNAVKYTHARGRIQLRLYREDSLAVVKVIDNGIGIPPENLQHVFDLFSQVREHQNHAGGGLGIGLSLVKSLVAHHGGSVSAESAGMGSGSTFTVRLPLDPAAQSERAPEPSEDSQTAAPSRRRVLVVDDNVDAAESMASLVALYGHDVEVAHSGVEALDKAQQLSPDLVFLDLGMPEMDGFETARRLRATSAGERAVLIALTGWGQAADRERTSAAGFDAHVVKPIDAGTLSRALAMADRSAVVDAMRVVGAAPERAGSRRVDRG